MSYLRRLQLLGIALVFIVALLAAYTGASTSHGRQSPLDRLNAVWYDLRFQLWPPQRDSHFPIVIVDLDEASLQREGRWPWDRAKVGQLVQSLQQRGAALIGFDVVFSEPSINPVSRLLGSSRLPSEISQALSPLQDEFDSDKTLAQALGQNTVLGYFFHADGGKAGELPFPFLELTPEAVQQSGLISMPDYTANLASLNRQALGSGFVVAVPDPDGIMRRMPLVMRYDTGVYASLSLEMVRLALGAPWLRLEQETHRDQSIITGIRVGPHLRVPLDERGAMLVPYRGPARSFPTVSATGVLQGDAPSGSLAALEGAVVLVGTSALGLSDLRTIPLQTGYPGVEVHANVIDTLLTAAVMQSQAKEGHKVADSPFYTSPDWGAGANFVLLLFTGLVLALFLPGRPPWLMLLSSSLWLVLVIALNVWLWHYWHLALPLALQFLLVVSLAGLNIAGGYVVSNQQKRTIQSLFGEYVPADHVARMVSNPGQVSLEGEQRTMSVLFADVRSFTALSERLSAAELKSVLNRYLSAITEVIFAHHGTIDKYVGDMVMAFWNAPLDDENHAEHAIRTALAMQARMVALRKEFSEENLPVFYIGIGINTGSMNVGDMGSRYRRAYTVLGDAVNLASRLESLTAWYRLPILVSDTSRQLVPSMVYRTVDLVRVKGRRQALTIFQPLDTQADALLVEHNQRHEQAIQYYRQRRWDQARELFSELAKALPADPVYRLYLQRMADIKPAHLPRQWSAVHSHETKS